MRQQVNASCAAHILVLQFVVTIVEHAGLFFAQNAQITNFHILMKIIVQLALAPVVII